MRYYTAITNSEHFTAGKRYPVLDYIDGGGIMTADDDNREHYISGAYLSQNFTEDGGADIEQ